jgi:ribosomal protein L11 methyltransferase
MSYRDWQGGEEIGPFRIGQMVFAPPWEQVAPSPNDVLIRLDPSVVFGNGLHPTTQGCLNALWRVYQRDRPKTVLDLGTGTGILALTCAKLGAERIVAVDYNPLAVKTATRNVVLNREKEHIEVVEGEAETFIREATDLICCNLHFPVLKRLLETEAFFEKRWYVLSGFFPSEAKRIVRRLQSRKLRLAFFSPNGPWQTILGFNTMSPVRSSLPPMQPA